MTRGCSWSLSRPSTILGYCCYSSAICGVIHGLLYLFSLQVWTFANWNNGKFVTFANFAKFADHKRFFFTFILLLNFLRYLLAFFFLSNAKFSFAIFAKFVDFWRAFFDFVLFRYERLQNFWFIILGINSIFVEVLFYDCNVNSCYFWDFCDICGLFEAFLAFFCLSLGTCQSSSWPFLFLRLEFCQIWKSC